MNITEKLSYPSFTSGSSEFSCNMIWTFTEVPCFTVRCHF